jgi:hypothetical protein
VELAVRGPYPQNFFALLRDGLELTLARFPGLEVRRLVPCPCGNGRPCDGEFDYNILLQRLDRGKDRVECQRSGIELDVRRLLFGWGAGRQEELLKELQRKLADSMNRQEERHRELLQQNQELIALGQRQFTALFNALQALEESHCPNVFVLRVLGQHRLKEALLQKLGLQLFCQAPGHWHPVAKGGRYEFHRPAAWLRPLLPYLQRLARVLRLAVPAVGLIAGPERRVSLGNGADAMCAWLDRSSPGELTNAAAPARAEGAALRQLRQLLEELDPVRHWGGLRKVYTPEGHYLWLCPDHAAAYER